VSGGNDQIGRTWDATSGEAKTTLIGHDNYIECCVFAPLSSYKHLATLAGLKKNTTGRKFSRIHCHWVKRQNHKAMG
jgi:WD40 repeat protein